MSDPALAVATATDTRKVAIVIPTLNEALHIKALVETMRLQVPERVVEIIVVDGGSTDATREIVGAIADTRVRLLINPMRLQSAAMNLAARDAKSEVTILIRVDAHARYPADFVAQLLAAYGQSGAQSVVNRLHSVGVTSFERAVAAASNSPFGTGGAAHRSGGAAGFIDHGHHALFDRATYLALGGYDESFAANEDAEYDTRLRLSGGRIWFTDKAVVAYFPRATAGALARQYYRYGRGRARTRAKHRELLRPRQMIPPVLTITLALSLLVALVWPITLVVPGLYLAGICAATTILIARTGDSAVWRASIVLPTMHLAWGSGFIAEVLSPTS